MRTVDLIYLGINEITDLGSLVIGMKLMLAKLIMSTLWTIHWDSIPDMLVYLYFFRTKPFIIEEPIKVSIET